MLAKTSGGWQHGVSLLFSRSDEAEGKMRSRRGKRKQVNMCEVCCIIIIIHNNTNIRGT